MGIRIDKFAALHDNWLFNDQYTLTAIVLHDPADKSTKRYLMENFNALSGATGDKMLFVSFVEPDEKEASVSYDPQDGRSRLAFENGWDDECLITMALDVLNVPHDQLPLLALTTSLENDRFYYIESSNIELTSKLLAISRFCNSEKDLTGITDERLVHLVRELGGNANLYQAICPIGKGLGSLLAPAAVHGPNSYSATRAMDEFSKMLNDSSLIELASNYKLWGSQCEEKVQEMQRPRQCRSEMRSPSVRGKRISDPEIFPSMEMSFQCLVTKDRGLHDSLMVEYELPEDLMPETDQEDLAGVKNCMVTSRCGWENKMSIFIPKRILDKCDVTSRREYKFYNTGIKNYRLDKACAMFRDNPYKAESLYDPEHVDYNALITKLGVILEGELNGSVVQVMRQVMGIPMPEYYRKWSQHNGKVIFPYGETGKLELNRLKKENGIERLLGLSLGEIKNGLNYMPKSYEEMNLFPDQETICQMLYTLSGKRNKASHATNSFCDFYDLSEARTNFMHILGENIRQLHKIKESLAPRKNP